MTPVKDHANNAALPVGGGASPIFKSSPGGQQHSPPQRDRPVAKPRADAKKDQHQVTVKQVAGDGGEGDADQYSESFEDDETHNPASLDGRGGMHCFTFGPIPRRPPCWWWSERKRETERGCTVLSFEDIKARNFASMGKRRGRSI